MSRLRIALGAALAWFFVGCNEQVVEVEQRSLHASEEIAFVCRDTAGNGLPRTSCPDAENVDAPLTKLYSLVTQTATNEVAIIDLHAAEVVDTDRSIPGFSFLRLPSRPGDIVTSPGGSASFVGLTSVGKTGVLGIPATCLGPPAEGQAGRDATTFPACALPSTPGDMAVLVEPPSDAGIRVSCAGDAELESGSPPGAVLFECDGVPSDDPACRRVRDCAANLTAEMGPSGRRKLAVALPSEGRIVVIDAQWLLDQPPGSFAECPIEASLSLASEVDPSGQDQKDPEGLRPNPLVCPPSEPPAEPRPPSFTSRPAGFALEGGRLYVADQGVPLVHVLDASSPCNLLELPPLLPMSFDDPAEVVTTSRVAASPLTPSGKRFVYAIDEKDRPTASVMAFDVSPGSTDRTPIVRRGSLRLPFEPSDRIQFGAPVADVTFALRDLAEEDPVTGVAPAGLYCDPDPALDPNSPAAQYRSRLDYTQGARPELLRGLFAFVMLTSGDIVVIDVDDLDAPCRRPLTTSSGEQDFRGCSSDPWPADPDTGEPLRLEVDGRPTVTNEASCNVVAPHRARSAQLVAVTTLTGVSAPTLRAAPQFSVPEQAQQLAPEERPKLLAVNFESPNGEGEGVPPEVYIGSTLYVGGRDGSLDTDPNKAEQMSVALPLTDPRNYAGQGDASELTYEGRITGVLPSGFFDFSTAVVQEGPAAEPVFVTRGLGGVSDSSATFCEQGVYDVEAMRDYGADVLGVAGDDALDAFARKHADYVQITGDFPDALDPYWLNTAACTRESCLAEFGSFTAQVLDSRRELTISAAYQDRLELELRDSAATSALSDEEIALLIDNLNCCFPAGTPYTIRASGQWVMFTRAGGFRHDVVARQVVPDDPVAPAEYRCMRDCNPRRALNRSRVFEITANEECEGCTVGLTTDGDPCSYDPRTGDETFPTRGVSLSEPAAACIVENYTARFAIYRGTKPSERDMRYSWDTVGGFIPMSIRLTAQSSAVLPQHIEYLPELQGFAIVDAASLGLSLVSIDTLRVDEPWPVF